MNFITISSIWPKKILNQSPRNKYTDRTKVIMEWIIVIAQIVNSCLFKHFIFSSVHMKFIFLAQKKKDSDDLRENMMTMSHVILFCYDFVNLNSAICYS